MIKGVLLVFGALAVLVWLWIAFGWCAIGYEKFMNLFPSWLRLPITILLLALALGAAIYSQYF